MRIGFEIPSEESKNISKFLKDTNMGKHILYATMVEREMVRKHNIAGYSDLKPCV